MITFLALLCVVINAIALYFNVKVGNYLMASLSAVFVLWGTACLLSGCTTSPQTNSSHVDRTPEMRRH